MSLLDLMALSACADLFFAIAKNPRASAIEQSLSMMVEGQRSTATKDQERGNHIRMILEYRSMFPSIYCDPSDANSSQNLRSCGNPLICSKAHR